MTGNREITISGDAQGNQIIQGDHNVVYVIYAGAAPSPQVLDSIQRGEIPLDSVPEAVPLPTLTLKISLKSDEWTITSHRYGRKPAARTAPAPGKIDPLFPRHLAAFWELTEKILANEEDRSRLDQAALSLGQVLAQALEPEEAELLVNSARGDGPPPFLVIESDQDLVLALPWELIRLDGQWPVRDGRLDLARSVPAPGAPLLQPPQKPVTLLINVSAPADSRLDYETESYFITRSLHDHVGVIVNEMGEIGDLVQALAADSPPLGVHFSGHGGPGSLVFENEYGEKDEIEAHDLLARLGQAGPPRRPRFFYLGCCHGHTAPALFDRNADGGFQPGVTSTAAQLHRDGLVQVVGHFGPVYDSQATGAEAAFYRQIGRGRRTREAVRAARTAMARPFYPGSKEAVRGRPGPDPAGLTPFAWAQLVMYHRGPDYPLGLPVPPRYPEEVQPQVRRREVPVFPEARTLILESGFIGRRLDLHDLRRSIREQRPVHVVQGLGGLGKTVFCQEAWKIYRKQGRAILALWCREAEDEPDPAAALVRQFSETAEKLFGETWTKIVSWADHQGLTQPALRLSAFLAILLNIPDVPPILLYLDNLESMLIKPDREDYDLEAVGRWRDEESAGVWAALVRLAQDSDGRLALLASCRYRQHDIDPWLWPLRPMTGEALFRLVGWFRTLRRLSLGNRDRLVKKLAGHPRAVVFLEPLVEKSRRDWLDTYGDPPVPQTQAEAQAEWDRFVQPTLGPLGDQISDDLLFEALWNRVLTPAQRRLLVRLTVLRRPADWDLVLALADPEAPPEEKTAAARELRRWSLLTEVAERRADGGLDRLYLVHPSVADLARGQAPDLDSLQTQAYRLAGDFLAERSQKPDWLHEIPEAGHYLFEAGEVARAFELLWGLAQELGNRGRCSHSLALLARFHQKQAIEALSWQDQGRLHVITSTALAGLGRLPQAAQALAAAIQALSAQADQDPINTLWQRDLSVSYSKLGDVLQAQGDLGRGEKAYQDALAIGERLAAQDPTNTEWQRDLSVSYERLGDVLQAQGDLGRAEKAYQDALAITKRLADQDPINTLWQRDLSVSYNKLGDLLRDQGDLGRAEKAYRDALAIRKRLAAQDPTNTLWQRDLSVSYNKLGDILLAQGDLGRGEKAYQDALAIGERLAAQDPTNTEWQRDLSVSYNNLGDLLQAQGDLGRAEKAYQDALAITKRLADQDPTNTLWRTDLVISSVKMTMVLDQNTAAGRDQARRLLENSLAILRPLQAAGRLTPKQQGWITDIEKRLARLNQPDGASNK